MEHNKQEAAGGIDLISIIRGLLKQLRSFWWLVLVLAVLGGGLMYWRSARNYRPMYQSEVIFSMTINSAGNTDLVNYSYYYDNDAAQLAAETFPHILSSDVMKERLNEALGTDYINGTVESAVISGTNFLSLTAKSANPSDAYALVQAIMELYPQICTSVLGNTQMIISQPPTLATEPYNTFSWQHSTAIGACTGLLLGLAILTVLSAYNQTVSTPDDVQKLVNLTCIAEIPNVRHKRRSGQEPALLITTQEADSAFCESFRLLRLKLLRQLKHQQDKTILVTSTLPSEGKSSMAVNTALSLAKDGKKVLLIDGDLRVQSIKAMLGITEPTPSLGDCLSGQADEIRCLRYAQTTLYVFAGSGTCEDPTPLLKHDRLQYIMELMRPQFDYIIVDTPPCAMMADAASLARYCDKAIYVIREDYASRPQILSGIQALTSSGVSICGFVMNRTTAAGSKHGYGYGYGYGYGKKYGYGYRYKTSNTQEPEVNQTTTPLKR